MMKECRAGRGSVVLALAILVGICVPVLVFCVYELLLEPGLNGEDWLLYLAGLALFGGVLVFGIHRTAQGLPYIAYDAEKVILHWNGREETVVPWETFAWEIQVGPLVPGGLVLSQRNPPQGQVKREIGVYPMHRGFREFRSALEAHGVISGGGWQPDVSRWEEYFDSPAPDVGSTCLEIARVITQSDSEVLSELQEALAAPERYLEREKERLQALYPRSEEELKRCAADPWWLMREILEQYQFVCTRDWKDEREDFLTFLFETRRAKAEGLLLDSNFFDFPQEGNIPEWSRLLEQKLAEKGLVVGYLGTEGDEYTVFFTTWKELALLERCASSIHQVISAVH